jgi:hypothetical protein
MNTRTNPRTSSQSATSPPNVGGANGQASADQLEREAKAAFEAYKEDRHPMPGPIDQKAFYGLPRGFVYKMAEHCECNLETLLFHFLIYSGNAFGRCAYVYAGGSCLFPNESVVCVGPTALGRKGSAKSVNDSLFHHVIPEWAENCIITDLQSGEGIVSHIRDEILGFQKGRRKPNQPPVQIVLDPGVDDKRLLDVEEEFSETLKMGQRKGSSLTEMHRKCWDSPRQIRTTNKNSPLKASNPHVSLLGHSTPEELLKTIQSTDLSNGFANRILWCASLRRVVMPDPPFLDWRTVPHLTNELKDALKQYPANTDDPVRFYRTDRAQARWETLYQQLTDQKGLSVIDGILVRDTSHLNKVALIYALLDKVKRNQGNAPS